MQKLIFSILAAGLASSALANDTAKVALVKRMYQEARSDIPGIEVVGKYADGALKRLIQNRDGDCLEADPMWGNQDPQTNARVNVSLLGNGKVRASFAQYGQRMNVTYTLNCSGSACKVSNVDGLKRDLQQCR